MPNFSFSPDWFPLIVANNYPTRNRAILRSAQPQDLKELARLLTECFPPHQAWLSCFHPLLTFGVYEDLRTRLHLPPSQYHCLIARQSVKGDYRNQEQIVGTIEIRQYQNFFGNISPPYISNLAVKPSQRRQGVASQLLFKCEQIAREWGARELTLHVLENNHAARQLYLASGYQIQQVEANLSNWLLQQPRRL